MLYRVDYVVALVVAGAIVAVLAGRRLAAVDARRVARGYLLASGVVVAVRVGLFIVRYPLDVHWPPDLGWRALGDLGPVLLGAAYGLAVLEWWRGGFAAVVRSPDVRFALCLSTGLGFVMTAMGSVFYIDAMRAFFAQSGYSARFLNFIMAIELAGGIALVLPWRWLNLAAAAGLAIDMFGAIYTHVHNGDPLDDSTGAVGMLLRLVPIAVMLAGRRWRGVGLGAVACAALAVAGSALVRQPATVPPPADEALDYFVGTWRCAGAFATGRHIEARLHAERGAGGGWLVMRHDDLPPNGYHALAEWSHGSAGWIGSWQDASGLRTFRSTGWQGDQLVWEGGQAGAADQRFRYRRQGDAQLEVSYETQGAAGWRQVDTLTCRRG